MKMILTKCFLCKEFNSLLKKSCGTLSKQLSCFSLPVSFTNQNQTFSHNSVGLNEAKSSEFPECLDELDTEKKTLLECISNKFLKPVKWCDIKYCFTVDDEVAKQIVESIKPYFLKENETVIEINPGLGLITNHLLEAGISKVIACEPTASVMPTLDSLIKDKPNRIELVEFNYFEKLKVGKNAKKKSLSSVFPIFEKAKNITKDGEVKPVKLIGVLSINDYFRSFTALLVAFDFQFLYDDLEHYLVVSSGVFNEIRPGNTNLSTRYYNYCFFQFLMDVTFICELPRKSFLPWSTKNDKMYLVKISRKLNTFEIINREEVTYYRKFLRVLAKSKFNFIIPTLEQWSPGCGIDLIKIGISMTTQTKDLTPKETVLLFNEFTKTTEYNNFKLLADAPKGNVGVAEPDVTSQE